MQSNEILDSYFKIWENLFAVSSIIYTCVESAMWMSKWTTGYAIDRSIDRNGRAGKRASTLISIVGHCCCLYRRIEHVFQIQWEGTWINWHLFNMKPAYFPSYPSKINGTGYGGRKRGKYMNEIKRMRIEFLNNKKIHIIINKIWKIFVHKQLCRLCSIGAFEDGAR